jgi:DNA-directed RNA polymerase specialized sigma24 family protein
MDWSQIVEQHGPMVWRIARRLLNHEDPKMLSPLVAAGVRELADHLREALAELDPRQAQVFCLASLEGLSYDEIAGQLRVTVNHVGVLLNRARTFLRNRLAAHRPPAVREAKKD